MASTGQRDPLVLAARVSGASRAVEILELEPHRYQVTIDGVAHTVDAQVLRPGSLSLLIDHRSYVVDVRSDGDRHRVDLAGRTIEVTLVDALRHGGLGPVSEAAGGPQEIRALMPGKIITILAEAGCQVEKGQGLLVVEAMKMENEVKAPAPGLLREILVLPGQTVEAGEILARLE